MMDDDKFRSLLKEGLKPLGDGIAEMKSDIRAIDTYLHKGNGKPALDVRIDRLERFQYILTWAGATVMAGTFLGLGGWIWTILSTAA